MEHTDSESNGELGREQEFGAPLDLDEPVTTFTAHAEDKVAVAASLGLMAIGFAGMAWFVLGLTMAAVTLLLRCFWYLQSGIWVRDWCDFSAHLAEATQIDLSVVCAPPETSWIGVNNIITWLMVTEDASMSLVYVSGLGFGWALIFFWLGATVGDAL